jgi:hypothetical protein
MDVRVTTVKVAERLTQTVPNCFEHVPVFAHTLQLRRRYRESKFKRQVEAGCGRVDPIEFYTREVVKRVATLADERKDAIKAPLPSRNLNRCARDETETTESGDQRQVLIFVTSVIRDIDKRIIVRAAFTTLVETPLPSGHQLVARALSWGFTSSSSQGMTRATPGSARSRHRFFRSELFFPNRPNRFGLLSLQTLHASLNRCRFRNACRDRVSNSYRVCQLNQVCCALFGYAELLCHTVYRGIRRRNHCFTSHTQKLTPAAPSCQFSEA